MRVPLLLVTLLCACASGPSVPRAALWAPGMEPLEIDDTAQLTFGAHRGNQTCEEAVGSSKPPVVARLSDGTFPLKFAFERTRPDFRTLRACGRTPQQIATDVLALVSGACVVGAYWGEFGGELSIFEKGQRVFELREGPVQFVRASGQSLLLFAYAHGDQTFWSVRRLLRSPEGQWSLEFIHGSDSQMLWAFGLDARGRLLLMTGASMSFGEKSDCFSDKRLYRLRENGQLEQFRSLSSESP